MFILLMSTYSDWLPFIPYSSLVGYSVQYMERLGFNERKSMEKIFFFLYVCDFMYKYSYLVVCPMLSTVKIYYYYG